MAHPYIKKAAGTSILLLILSLGIFSQTPGAEARFSAVGRQTNYDGIVTAVTPTSITLDTNGSNPIALQVNRRTRFARRSNLADIQVGDAIFVNSRNNIAQLVRPEDEESAYGTAGDPVRINRGTVISKSTTSFVVRTLEGNDTTLQVTPQTRFVGRNRNFAGLEAGDRVIISGEDTGADFVAERVSS